MKINNLAVFLITLIFAHNASLWAFDEDDTDLAPAQDIDVVDNQVTNNTDEEKLDITPISFKTSKGAPVLDGKIDEDFWLQGRIFHIDMELYPERFSRAVVETFARVVITDTHAFINFDARDPDVSKLRSAPREHDANKEDDYVSLIIDPSGSGARKFEFRINPHGSQSDVLQDTVSDRYIYDWDTNWSAAAAISEHGYTVEIALPLQSIKFTATSDEHNPWLIMFKRTYPRNIDRTFGKPVMVKPIDRVIATVQKNQPTQPQKDATPPQDDDFFSFDSNADTIIDEEDFAQTQNKEDQSALALQTADITPHYIYHRDEERDIGGSFDQVEEYDVNEFGVTGNLRFDTARSLAFSINPNFTEVEADISRESINNTFTPFQPEKREIFQAGADLYNTLLPLVYTRNIIQPEVALSYSHHGGNYATGFFWSNDKETEIIMPDNLGSQKITLRKRSQSAGVRYQQNIGKQTLGFTGTMRKGVDDYKNTVAAVDGFMSLGMDDKLRYQLAYSESEYPESFAEDLCEEDGCVNEPQPSPCTFDNCETNAYVKRAAAGDSLAGHALRVNYKHSGPSRLYWLNYYDVHEDFRADLGLTRRTDFRGFNLAYGRRWYIQMPGDDGKSRLQAYLALKKLDSQDGDQLEESATLYGEFRGSLQTVLRVGATARERAVNRIDLSDLTIEDNAPLFDERFWVWYYEVAPSSRWTLNFDGKYGEQANADNLVLGDIIEFRPRLRYRLDNFQFDLKATLRDFEVDNERLFRETFYTFSMTYRRNKNASHRLLYLHDRTRRDLDLWSGFDETAFEEEITLEYTYTYTPNRLWRILAGVKLAIEDNSDDQDKDLTDREVYIKVERSFNLNL